MSKTDITIICRGCGNEGMTEVGEEKPANAHHVESNYCPKCEKEHQGDYFEDYFCDKDGKEIKP